MALDPLAERGPAETRHLRTLSRLLDTAVRVPGTNIRFGLDPIVGLIPGVGDLAGAVMSGYIVLAATRLGVPTAVVARMLLNIGIDTLVGSVPVVGDLFDAAWKSNAKNVALIESHLADRESTRRSSRWVVSAIVVAVVVLLALAGVGIVALLFRLFRS